MCLLAAAILAGCHGAPVPAPTLSSSLVPAPSPPLEVFSWSLATVPEAYEGVGAVALPLNIEVPDYEFWLLRSESEGDVHVGVYRGTAAVGDCEAQEVEPRSDLPGLHACIGGNEVIIASRDLPLEAALEAIDVRAQDVVLDDFHVVAYQQHASVPGLGSVPVSFFSEGSVLAYVKEGTGEGSTDQVSLAIAGYAGERTDLNVFDWWYGSDATSIQQDGVHLYTFPALDGADGGSVPNARLAVRSADGTVLMVRVVGDDVLDPVQLVQSVDLAPLPGWARTFVEQASDAGNS